MKISLLFQEFKKRSLQHFSTMDPETEQLNPSTNDSATPSPSREHASSVPIRQASHYSDEEQDMVPSLGYPIIATAHSSQNSLPHSNSIDLYRLKSNALRIVYHFHYSYS